MLTNDAFQEHYLQNGLLDGVDSVDSLEYTTNFVLNGTPVRFNDNEKNLLPLAISLALSASCYKTQLSEAVQENAIEQFIEGCYPIFSFQQLQNFSLQQLCRYFSKRPFVIPSLQNFLNKVELNSKKSFVNQNELEISGKRFTRVGLVQVQTASVKIDGFQVSASQDVLKKVLFGIYAGLQWIGQSAQFKFVDLVETDGANMSLITESFQGEENLNQTLEDKLEGENIVEKQVNKPIPDIKPDIKDIKPDIKDIKDIKPDIQDTKNMIIQKQETRKTTDYRPLKTETQFSILTLRDFELQFQNNFFATLRDKIAETADEVLLAFFDAHQTVKLLGKTLEIQKEGALIQKGGACAVQKVYTFNRFTVQPTENTVTIFQSSNEVQIAKENVDEKKGEKIKCGSAKGFKMVAVLLEIVMELQQRAE